MHSEFQSGGAQRRRRACVRGKVILTQSNLWGKVQSQFLIFPNEYNHF